MTNTTPIILDRLESALAAHGVNLKRNQLLDVAAAAYGYRNNNAFSAAAKGGDLAPPKPESIHVDEYGLHVLRDPITGDVFAIDPRSASVRAQQWCLSPYGGLLDVSGLEFTPRAEITMHTATISHRHGTNFYVAATAADLDRQIAGYCEEYWSEALERDDDLPEDASGLSDEEVSTLYFGAVDDEFIEKGEDRISAAPALVRMLTTQTGEAWVISRTDLESDDPVLWWNDADGWGDLASATAYPDKQGRLPTVGMEESSVAWERLPTAVVKAGAIATPGDDANVDWQRMEGTAATDAAAARLLAEGIEAVPGVVFRTLRSEGVPDGRYRDGYRRRIVMQTNGGYDADAASAWSAEVAETLARANATVSVTATGASVVFDGDAAIAEAASTDTWMKATADLLAPLAERERIMADFRPEVWIRNNAVEVDGEGEKCIDVTYEMLLLGRDDAFQLTSGDTDYLKEAVRVPRWIADWTGPFTILVADAIEDTTLFD